MKTYSKPTKFCNTLFCDTAQFTMELVLCSTVKCLHIWFHDTISCPHTHTGWRTKCHTIDCAYNTFLLLQKHLTSGTELTLIGWKIFPNEEHVQCDHRLASQPLANEP